MNSPVSKRDGILIGLFLVLIVTQIPTSVKDHKINVCRELIEKRYGYLVKDDSNEVKSFSNFTSKEWSEWRLKSESEKNKYRKKLRKSEKEWEKNRERNERLEKEVKLCNKIY